MKPFFSSEIKNVIYRMKLANISYVTPLNVISLIQSITKQQLIADFISLEFDIQKQIHKEYNRLLFNMYTIQNITNDKDMSFVFLEDDLVIRNSKYSNKPMLRFKKGEKLGEGTFGVVNKYTIKPELKHLLYPNFDLAIKKNHKDAKTSKNEENINDILEKIKEKNKNCNIIPLRQLDSSTFLMLKGDIELFDWIEDNLESTRHKNLHFILHHITYQALCLLETNEEYLYADIKPENIILKLDNKNNIKNVHLVDIDSVLRKSKKHTYTHTFPCQENMSNFPDKKSKQVCIAFNIATLAYDLIEGISEYRLTQNDSISVNKQKMIESFSKHKVNQNIQNLLHNNTDEVIKALMRIRNNHFS